MSDGRASSLREVDEAVERLRKAEAEEITSFFNTFSLALPPKPGFSASSLLVPTTLRLIGGRERLALPQISLHRHPIRARPREGRSP